MVAARDQLRAVGEMDSIPGLDRLPVSQDRGPDVPPVTASTFGSVDGVADPKIRDGPEATIPQ
jgi:hypothetical protein